MTSKQEIISKMYFDKSGFGSRAVTLTNAREKDNSIKMEDVAVFFNKHAELKKQLRGFDCHIATRKDHEC